MLLLYIMYEFDIKIRQLSNNRIIDKESGKVDIEKVWGLLKDQSSDFASSGVMSRALSMYSRAFLP